MPLDNTVRGLSSAMTCASGSATAGRLQTCYGILIVDRPAVASYRSSHITTLWISLHEDRIDHRLLLRLWAGDRTPLSRSRLERRRHHAKPARGPAPDF